MMALIVPTFNRKTAMTTSVSAARLGTQASPSAMTAGLAAQGQAYSEMADTAAGVFGGLLRQVRQNTMAGAEAKAATELADVKRLAQLQPAATSEAWFNERAADVRKRIAATLVDPIVRSRFLLKSGGTAALIAADVANDAWTTILNENVAAVQDTSDSLKQDFIDARIDGDVRKQTMALNEITGMTTDEGWQAGLFERAADMQLITFDKARTLRNAWLLDTVRAEVREDIRNDPGEALNNLRELNEYRFNIELEDGTEISIGLDENSRAIFIDRAEHERDARTRQHHLDRIEEERRIKADRAERHRFHFGAALRLHIAWRQREGEGPALTESYIGELEGQDKISESMAVRLLGMVGDKAPNNTNVPLYMRIQSQIMAALSTDDLEAIEEVIESEVGVGGGLTQESALSLLGLMRQKLDADPRFKEYDRFRRAVTVVFSGSPAGYTGVNLGSEEQKRILAQALLRYDEMTLAEEPGRALEPAVAYEEIRAAFFPAQVKAAPTIVPFREFTFGRSVGKGQLEGITEVEVAAARERLMSLFSQRGPGQIPRQDLNIEWQKLEEIERWIKQKQRFGDPSPEGGDTPASIVSEDATSSAADALEGGQ